MMRRALLSLATLAVVGALAACDARANPLTGITPRPPIEVLAGEFSLREVDDEPLPHDATNSGTVYSLVSGTFSLHADSTWLFSTMEVLRGTNGTFIGSSPANYQGTWKVSDSTITLLPSYGTVKVKGDTLFWTGGPRHTWEETLEFTLVRR